MFWGRALRRLSRGAAALRRVLVQANDAYYTKGVPVMTDEQYDALLNQLRDMETKDPALRDFMSPTQTVGALGTAKCQHVYPMLSLASTPLSTEGSAKVQHICSKAQALDPTTAFVLEGKLDGVAISVLYVDGRLARVATRGNGILGDDITSIFMEMCPSVPRQIPLQGMVDIRGEMVLKDSTCSGARNKVAGILRSGFKEDESQIIDFIPYQICSSDSERSQTQDLELLSKMSFKRNPVLSTIPHAPSMSDLEKLQEASQQSAYSCDGIVLKVDSKRAQKEMGYTSREPRWAIAVKFVGPSSTSQVCGVSMSVGRTGKLTPVISINPVKVQGSTISSVSVSTISRLYHLQLREGDYVEVQRAGSVIPYIVGKVGPSLFPDRIPLQLVNDGQGRPLCPCPLQSLLVEQEPNFFCTDAECPNMALQRLCHFVSKAGISFPGCGPSVVERLSRTGYVKHVTDFFRLHEHKSALLDLEGFGTRKVDQLLKGIDHKRKNASQLELLLAFGIPRVSKTTAKTLLSHFTSLQSIANASPEQLQLIAGVGPKTAESLHEYVTVYRLVEVLRSLEQLGVYAARDK